MNIYCLFPHCDDEYFISEFLKSWATSKDRLMVFFLTQDVNVPEIRKAESLRYLSTLGIEQDAVTFVYEDIPVRDARMIESFSDLHRYLSARVQGPGVVVAPAWEGGHQDHEIAYLLAKRFELENAGLRAKAYYLYNGDRCPKPLFRVNQALRAQVAGEETKRLSRRKALRTCREVFGHYPSQKTTWLGLSPLYLAKLMKDPGQALYTCRPEVGFSRPHSGSLHYETFRRTTWDAFVGELKEQWPGWNAESVKYESRRAAAVGRSKT